MRDAHPYAHRLGRQIYAYYTNFPKAFSQCEPRYASGCYHGVLEGFLNSKKNGIRVAYNDGIKSKRRNNENLSGY